MNRTSSHWTSPLITPKVLPTHVDVAIIGAGIAGCSAALELHKAGVSFALLEQQESLGTGISSREIGHSKLGLGDNPARLHSSLGTTITQDILQYTYENSLWLVEQGFALHRGGLYIAKNKAEGMELQQSAAILTELQWDITPWTAQQVNAHFQSKDLYNGYFHPHDVSYSPTQFFTHCNRLHENIVTACQVLDIRSADTLKLHTSRGDISCEVIIVANNSHAGILEDFFSEKISPVRLQTISVPSAQQRLPAHCQFGYIQWRDIDNIRLISGCRWGTPHLEIGESDDSILSPQIGAHLRRFAETTFGIRDNPLLEWTGIMGFSCDGLPMIGPLPGTSDILACCGFSGNQSALGFRAGRSMARLILHGKDLALPSCFLPSRFL